MPKKDNHVYALYKGDNILSIGTKKELAKNLNVDIKTITYYVSNAYKKLCNKREGKYKNGFIEAVDLGEDII